MSAAPQLIAVDGVNGRALAAAARRLAPRGAVKRISHWDASGVFEQLLIDPDDDFVLAPRLLLLLYAADLAFRLRWEIEPTLAAGRSVVAAPYIETGMAFGRACGVPGKWLNNLFWFARKPAVRHIAGGAVARSGNADSFVEFGCAHLPSADQKKVAMRTKRHLSAKGPSRRRRRAR